MVIFLRQVLEVCQCLMCLVVRAIDWQRVTKNSLSITKNILTTFNIMNNPSTVWEPAATTLRIGTKGGQQCINCWLSLSIVTFLLNNLGYFAIEITVVCLWLWLNSYPNSGDQNYDLICLVSKLENNITVRAPFWSSVQN